MKLEKIAPENTPAKRHYPNDTCYRVIDAPQGWCVVFIDHTIPDPFSQGYRVNGGAYFTGPEGRTEFVDYYGSKEEIDKVRERIYKRFFAASFEERAEERAEIYRRIAEIIEEEEK